MQGILQEIVKIIIRGTSDSWSMRRLFHQDCRIFESFIYILRMEILKVTFFETLVKSQYYQTEVTLFLASFSLLQSLCACSPLPSGGGSLSLNTVTA